MKNEGGMAVVIGMGGGAEEIGFPAPEGFDYEDMKAGEEKEVLAKVRYDGGDGFTLVSVDGYPLGGAMEEEEMPEEMPEGEMEEAEEEVPFQDRLRQRAGLA